MNTIRAYRETSASIGGGTDCWVFVEPPLAPDFARSLVAELYALARPVGLGEVEASTRKKAPTERTLEASMRESGLNTRGNRRRRGEHWFDYVGGYRIKVSFLPLGLELVPEFPAAWYHPGWPVVSSVEFEEMYGDGALESAVRLALTR